MIQFYTYKINLLKENINKNRNKMCLNIALIICYCVFIFLVIEILLRAFSSPGAPFPNMKFYNYIDTQIPGKKFIMYNKDLGWENIPNFIGHGPFGEDISIDSMGLRNNDIRSTIKNKPIILSVGDSFTFGQEVDNCLTWPSQLEKISGIRILNGGITSYGLDQMLTKTKYLIEKLDINIIIVAFIESDIERVKQIKRHGYNKPHYTIQKDKLILNRANYIDFSKKDLFKQIFGYSYTIHLIMLKFYKNYWIENSFYDTKDGDFDEVKITCKIIDEFSQIANIKNIKILFSLLPNSYDNFSLEDHPVIYYIKKIIKNNKKIFFIDINKNLLLRKNNMDRNLFSDINKGYHGHYTKEGNEFVAEELFNFINSSRILEQ